VEFMVSIDVRTPADLDPARLAALQAAEALRARELVEQGTLKRIWRIPGRRSNVSLYEAPDATVLHAALSSLPLFPYMEIEVQALATHPVEASASPPLSR
jgi:muconolactone D-isomerase